MDYENNLTLFAVLNHFGFNEVLCLVCTCFSRRDMSVLVMAFQLLYAHARTEEDDILFLQTNGLLTRTASNCPTNETTILIKKSVLSLASTRQPDE